MMKESITFKELQDYIRAALKSLQVFDEVGDEVGIRMAYKKIEAAVTIADDLFQVGGRYGGKESA